MTMKVAILMGSEKDIGKMEACSQVLQDFGVEHEVHVMSAHRTPEKVAEFTSSARENGFGVIICGAGKAAHLAGAVAAHTTLPVIGIPISSGGLGWSWGNRRHVVNRADAHRHTCCHRRHR